MRFGSHFFCAYTSGRDKGGGEIRQRYAKSVPSFDLGKVEHLISSEQMETNLFGEQIEVKSEYTQFVEKFKPKQNTDDCYTPPEVYAVIKQYVLESYGIDEGRTRVIRPFKPLGDYQSEDYSGDCVVIDNPPFSILASIIDWYMARGVRFFLFASHLTLFQSGKRKGISYVVTSADITYENGAKVNTSFVTNLPTEPTIEIRSSLQFAIREAQNKAKPKRVKYVYPNNVISSALLSKYVDRGLELVLPRSEAYWIREMDAQRSSGKQIFGSGFLVSDAVAETILEANEERKGTSAYLDEEVWELSPRELDIIRTLGGKKGGGDFII